MTNLPTKFEVHIFTRYGNMKGVAKRRKWGGLGRSIFQMPWGGLVSKRISQRVLGGVPYDEQTPSKFNAVIMLRLI